MDNTYLLEKLTQMRQQEFEEKARQERLIREIEGQKPRLWPTLTWQVGDWLITLGSRLMENNLNPMEAEYETAQFGSQNLDLPAKRG